VKSVNFLGKRIPMPSNIILRVVLGLVFVFGGFLGFLPILGFWMLPLGLLILSIDFPPVRRFRRRATVLIVGWLKRRFPKIAARMGLT
jgi:purine-cytosine permease-like protein